MIKRFLAELGVSITPKGCAVVFWGSAFLAFGMYNVHSVSGVTEGGVLGLTLLLDNWFDISPAVSGFVLNMLCYALGLHTLGRTFLAYSAVSAVSFSAAYAVFERFEPLWPQLVRHPLAAAFFGAIFVGVGAGVCVRVGGATGGDDALAMSIIHLTGLKIETVYLLEDIVVLGLSLTYISLGRIWYSLLTVIISGKLVGIIQRVGRAKEQPAECGELSQ